MNHITRMAAAALLATGFAQGASAQWLTTTQDGDSIVVHGRDPNHNIVGGALVRMTGSGEGATTETLSVNAVQSARNVRVVGSGENQSVVEIEAAQPARFAATMGDRG
ncbi:hypothetical protein [Falsiroseomonas sp. E2-1-a20]|uniref:hypothetical protein n=1 Tax=Falsiroseomonas sp. E2-1-a20 TaxID=3239300 RepID=UPI003F2C102B